LRRTLLLLAAFLIVIPVLGAVAQTRPAQVGDPPIVARIEVSAPNRFGVVTITGASGAIFPSAYIGIRNLWTGETAYGRAGITGSFVIEIAGTSDAPYWISPAGIETPRDRRQQPGSMPGGPGAIVQRASGADVPSDEAITQIVIDGDLRDWDAYPDADLLTVDGRTLYALRNADSLYVAIDGAGITFDRVPLTVTLTIDRSTYRVRLYPYTPTRASSPQIFAPPSLERINPNQTDLGVITAVAFSDAATEVRIPLSFTERQDIVQLDAIEWEAASEPPAPIAVNTLIPLTDAIDGIARRDSALPFDAPSFATGALAGIGADGLPVTWSIKGRVNSTRLTPGDRWRAEIEVTLTGLTLPPHTELTMGLMLQPIALANGAVSSGDGAVSSGSLNNGWSSRVTASGIPIDGGDSAFAFVLAAADLAGVIRRGNRISFPLTIDQDIPDTLAPGLYTLGFAGYFQTLGETRSDTIRWDRLDLAVTAAERSRLPIVFNVGDMDEARLPMALFADDLSDGSRGILPIDADDGALSNRVRTNAPTLILPPYTSTAPRRPIIYALEPYLPNILPNRYDSNAPPLIPFDLPGGRLTGRVRTPSGTTDALGAAPFAQNRLSTIEYDESALFGDSSPLDMFRLTTLEPRFTEYTFAEYGEYQITLTGTVSDSFGNVYVGGGEYRVLAAELLDLTPGTLPGAPYTVGDVVNPSLRIAPGYAADVTVTVRFYPIDGGAPLEQALTGTADRAGMFIPDQPPLIFQQPGEYVIDYEARYTAVDGSLWAGSLRSAGVVAPTDDTLHAHGARGTDRAAAYRPAWFDVARYAEVNAFDPDDAALYPPYHSGDLMWIDDGAAGAVHPRVRLEDRSGVFSRDLGGTRGEFERQEIPIDDAAGYTYISVVRPNVTLLQAVTADDGGGLPIRFDADDALNRQIGAGIDGMLPGDLFFMFGGAVVRLPDAAPRTAGYASAGVVLAPDADPGERVMPPARGLDGGADGGTLLTFRGIDYDAVIVPTGLQPGDVLTEGDSFIFAGQVAPTLHARVRVTYTKPSGATVTVEGSANSFGGFFEIGGLQVADEPGLWSARVEVTVAGRTSAGVIEAPGIRAGIAGLEDGRFTFAVLPPDTESLPWSSALTDSIIAIGLPYNFNFTAPQGWTDVRAFVTMTTPGYVLDDAELRVSGRSFSYQYTAAELGRRLSIIERDVRTSGAYVSDTRALTFIATGFDENGEPAIRARAFTLLHDRLVTTP